MSDRESVLERVKSKKPITRRELFELAGLTAAAVGLVACSPDNSHAMNVESIKAACDKAVKAARGEGDCLIYWQSADSTVQFSSKKAFEMTQDLGLFTQFPGTVHVVSDIDHILEANGSRTIRVDFDNGITTGATYDHIRINSTDGPTLDVSRVEGRKYIQVGRKQWKDEGFVDSLKLKDLSVSNTYNEAVSKLVNGDTDTMKQVTPVASIQ